LVLQKENITFSDMLAAARRSDFEQRISGDHGKNARTPRKSTHIVPHANTDSEKKTKLLLSFKSGTIKPLVLGFLNKVSNILLEFTAVTRYLIPLERGTEDVAHKPVYYHTFFE